MRCKLILLSLLLCLCTACAKEPDPDYTFPPERKAELMWALDEAGLEWTIWEHELLIGERENTPNLAVYLLESPDKLMEASLNASEQFGMSLHINFGYRGSVEYDVMSFEQGDYLSMWKLAGILFECPKEAEKYYELWSSHFEKQGIGKTGDSLMWQNGEGDIACVVTHTWHEGFGMYVPDGIQFSEPQ